MKSSLGFAMLYNAVLEGRTSGIYVTLEQSKESLAGHMANMGMNVDGPRVRSNIALSIWLIFVSSYMMLEKHIKWIGWGNSSNS